ncbi:MAG TPA: hypothetical protein VF622_00875 [Segetibacter sp.]|jgi:hypothetical protein
MTEETKRKWDVFLGILGSIATAAAIYAGVWQFIENQNYNSRLEFKREMFPIQLEKYARITEIAGVLASEYSSDKLFAEYKKEYEKMYWGSINIINDTSTSRAMINLREAIRDYSTISHDQAAQERIKDCAAQLAEACKKSLDDKWHEIK